jgi:hypothetical protein
MFALVFVMQSGTWLSSNTDPEAEEGIIEAFGTVATAMLSLIAMSTDGGWPDFYEVLEPTGPLNQSFLLAFVAFSQIALLNIILGVFVDAAMNSMEVSKEDAALEHIEGLQEIEGTLRALCKAADPNSTGYMTKTAWNDAVDHKGMKGYLDFVGLRDHNVMSFFDAVANLEDEKRANIDIFIMGLMRMKDAAGGFDISRVVHHVKVINRIMHEQRRDMRLLVDSLKQE